MRLDQMRFWGTDYQFNLSEVNFQHLVTYTTVKLELIPY